MELAFVEKAKENKGRKALIDQNGSYTYQYLLQASASVAAHLLDGEHDLQGARVAFMINPGMYFVACQWAIWRAGAVAVPLHTRYPLPAVRHVLEDAGVEILIVDQVYKEALKELEDIELLKIFTIEQLLNDRRKCELPVLESDRNALIIYTSGTTSQPKGVLTTHAALEAQISTLVDAWNWSADDHILNVLPLHHVHGLINALACPLWVGACCEIKASFDAAEVWSAFAERRINVFMAVPTIYYKLIAFYESVEPYLQKRFTEAMQHFRLMVSGSAALPVSVLDKWRKISNYTLLERYGMTEIGMALSNPYEESKRRAGFVGQPLPGVDIRLYDEENNRIITEEDQAGEIQVKGANVFKAYWRNPLATENAFTEDGWFITGDIALLQQGAYKILGRKSTDIIKSGGYKISALEVEEVIRKHEEVTDCAVVALPNEEWGEVIAVGIVALPSEEIQPLDDRVAEWLKSQLPPYKIPRRWVVLKELPRNALGKVQKHTLKKMFI